MVFLQNLLLWFQHDDGDASNCVMLDLLNDLTHQQGVSAKLCSLGLPALLENLCISSGPEVKQKAHRTLTALLQSASTRLASAAGQQAQELSVHDPRSRCQSNSPAGLQHHPSGKTQLVPGSNRQYHSKPVKRMILTPQCSHAFGSQQGKFAPTQQVSNVWC